MKGIERFTTYLNQWEDLAREAKASENIAEFVLNKEGRTIFFMLEGLSKIYKNLHDGKMFSKMGDKFKAVEHLLGYMDHYRECIDDFSKKEETPARVMEYFKSMYNRAQRSLNDLFEEEGWMSGRRTEKTIKKLNEAEWMKEEKEMKAVRKYYLDEIQEFKSLYKQTGQMTLIEDHLHEFRRRLRWFSIYPHAVQGAIQFYQKDDRADALKKYHTEEIVSSPFNKFPAASDHKYALFLERNHFLALSWLIDALGKLKDKGLLEENLLHAMRETKLPFEEPLIMQTEEKILSDANTIMQNFMKDEVLENLVGEVKPINN